jgi:E3 ubiquitin-protein ligase CHFR
MINSSKEALNEEITSKLQCAICIAIMSDPMTATPCMHNFCKGCIEEWMKTSYKKECPMCKVKIQDLKKNALVANIIQVITKKQQ